MAGLKNLLEKQKYDVSDLLWNEERNVFEMMVKPSEADEKKMEIPEEYVVKRKMRSVKIGRAYSFA